MGIFRTFDRIIAKATYDPELEKQLAEERNQARQAKKKFREGISKLKVDLTAQVEKNTITPEGVTYVKALIKEAESWLSGNPDATADEINDKAIEFMDKLATIYEDDKGRIYHVYFTTLWKTWITSWKALNAISEDKAKEMMKIVDEEQLWYKKHLKETPDTYVERINEMVEKLKPMMGPDFDKDIREKMAKKPESPQEVEKAKAEAEKLKKDKEALEKKNFDVKRIAKKATAGVSSAVFWSVLISFALFGASIASNMALVRPTPIRVLCWFYGLIFFIPVILYAAIQYIMGNKPYFGAYLIPLYMYDPITTEKKSFLEKLVWYKDNPVLQQARRTFEAASNASVG